MRVQASLAFAAAVVGMVAAAVAVAVPAGLWPVAGIAEAQSPGCQFQIFTRPPMEFAGPAGGQDFELYNPTHHRATIQISNVYGTDSCTWRASVNVEWITLTMYEGTLTADSDNIVTVRINDRASEMSRGTHRARITFTSRQDPQPDRKKQVQVILYAQEPCDLQIIGGSYLARMMEGAAPPPTVSQATLSNGGDAPCQFRAHSNVPWLTVSPTSGVVPAQRPQALQIKANTGARSLPPGDYQATVQLQWRETHDQYQEIRAQLEIDAPPCELEFPPGQAMTITGTAGLTEFYPPQQKFLLQNAGGTPCFFWEAFYPVPWLSVADETTIYPGNATEVVVQVNQPAAAQLRPGPHAAKITFGAGNDYASHGLDVAVNVEPQPCHLEIEETDLNFNIPPVGAIRSDFERLFTITNGWQHNTCHWESDTKVDWLITEPESGTIAGGSSEIAIAKIVESAADFARLEPGSHSAKLGLNVASGTVGEPVDVTIEIDCNRGEPCALLHTSHKTAYVGDEIKITLSLYNPGGRTAVAAALRAVLPDGWNAQGWNLADRCSESACTATVPVVGGGEEFIEITATLNNAGLGEVTASVDWTNNVQNADGTSATEILSTILRTEVEVFPAPGGPAPANTAPAIPPGAPSLPSVPLTAVPALVPTAPPAIAPTAAPAVAPEEPVAVTGDDTAAVTTDDTSAGPPGGPADAPTERESGISMRGMILIIGVGVVLLIGGVLVALRLSAGRLSVGAPRRRGAAATPESPPRPRGNRPTGPSQGE